MSRGRGRAALVQPEEQRLARLDREAARGVGLLDAPELAVVGQDHLVEQDLARLGGDPASRRAALPGRPTRGTAARGDGEGAVELLVIDADLLRTAVSGRVDGIRLGRVLLEEANPLEQAVENLLPRVAVLIEERRDAARLPLDRVTDAGERVGERRVRHRSRARQALRGLGQLHVIGLGTSAPHPRVAERDLVADADGVVARGQVVQAEHAAQAEQAPALEGPLEREDQIRVVPGDVVVEADPEAEGAQHAEGAHASVDLAPAHAQIALARDADGGDR